MKNPVRGAALFKMQANITLGDKGGNAQYFRKWFLSFAKVRKIDAAGGRGNNIFLGEEEWSVIVLWRVLAFESSFHRKDVSSANNKDARIFVEATAETET